MLTRTTVVFFLLLILSGCNDPDAKLKAIVEEANKNYPAMLDSETRIENIEVTGENTLRYNYTLVNYQYDQVKSRHEAAART
jgi:hypothetical protein